MNRCLKALQRWASLHSPSSLQLCAKCLIASCWGLLVAQVLVSLPVAATWQITWRANWCLRCLLWERMLITLMFNVHRKTPLILELLLFQEFDLVPARLILLPPSTGTFLFLYLFVFLFFLGPFLCSSVTQCQLHSRASFVNWHFDQAWSLFGIKWQPIYWRYEHFPTRQSITCQQKASASVGGLKDIFFLPWNPLRSCTL